MARRIALGLMALALCATAACTNPTLRNLQKPGEGPDEFRIVPGKPLQDPPNYTALPAPIPRGANLTDQAPLTDGIAALGGRVQGAQSIPASDGALVNAASRFGRQDDIRATLAEEDEAFRTRRGRFTQIRIVPTDNYAVVYQREALDPFREVERWRRAGARVPSAPPL